MILPWTNVTFSRLWSDYFTKLATRRIENQSVQSYLQGRIRGGGGGGGESGGPDPPLEFGKKVVIRFVIGTGLILHSIYVNYSHKSKKGSKCGDIMVRT